MLASNWWSQFCWSFGCSRLRGLSLALLHSNQHLASLQPSSPTSPGPTGSGKQPLQGYGYTHGAFVVSTLPGSCGLRPSEMCTLPGASELGPEAPHTPAGVPGGQVERRLELLLQESSPKCPRVSFSFWENHPAQSCHSLRTRKGLSSRSAHLSS